MKLIDFIKNYHIFFVRTARHPIASFCFLLLITVVICFFVFYNYYFLVNEKPIDISGGIVAKKAVYNDIINVLKTNEGKINEENGKKYENIFGSTSAAGDVKEEVKEKN